MPQFRHQGKKEIQEGDILDLILSPWLFFRVTLVLNSGWHFGSLLCCAWPRTRGAFSSPEPVVSSGHVVLKIIGRRHGRAVKTNDWKALESKIRKTNEIYGYFGEFCCCFFFSFPPTFSKGDALGVGKTLRIRLWLLNRSPCLRPPLIFHGDIRDSQKPFYLQGLLAYSRKSSLKKSVDASDHPMV